MKSKALIGICALAILMVSTSASAQSRREASPSQPTAPWYERFTFGSDYDAGVNAWTPRGEPKATLRLNPRARWGVSFGMEAESRRPLDRRNNGSTSAGAFYDLSPKVRLGGQVVVPENSATESRDRNRRGPSVKLQSAFRF